MRHLLAHASGVAPEGRIRSFPPAQRRVYSNVGIEMAADMLRSATGIAFADYLTEAVIDPLGMRNTSLPGSPARDGVSSVADLAQFAAELLTPKGLLSTPASSRQTPVGNVAYLAMKKSTGAIRR